MTVRFKLLLLSLLLLATGPEASADDFRDLFSEDAIRDAGSLKLEILSRTREPAIDDLRGLTVIESEFTSFHWAGEEWRHPAKIFLPEERTEKYQGAGVIVSSPRPDHPVNLKYARAAAQMGIPVLMIAGNNPGPHYGHPNEGNLMGFGSKRFRETGDSHWIGYAWLGKVITRGVTAAQEIDGFDADRFVVTGCSKRGAAAWIAAGADSRIVGAYPTCWNAGNFEAWLNLKAERWGLDYQPSQERRTIAPAFITTRQQIENARQPRGREEQLFTDPYQFRRRLKGKRILYAAGSNDRLFPVASDTVFLPQMPETIRVHLVPNAGHGLNTDRNRTAWKMWLAHCFADRDVPRIYVASKENAGWLDITAGVDSATRITKVRCWYAHDSDGAFLESTWQSGDMQVESPERWTLRLPRAAGVRTGVIIEVEDEDPRTVPGIITSGFHEWIPKSSSR